MANIFCVYLFHIILATVIVSAIAIMKTFDTGRFGKLSFYPTRLFSEKGDRGTVPIFVPMKIGPSLLGLAAETLKICFPTFI